MSNSESLTQGLETIDGLSIEGKIYPGNLVERMHQVTKKLIRRTKLKVVNDAKIRSKFYNESNVWEKETEEQLTAFRFHELA